MSHHDAVRYPQYNTPAIREALKQHGLDVDKPSQLSDSFRHGYRAALASAPATPPVEQPAGWKFNRGVLDEIVINGPIGGCVVQPKAAAPRTIPEEILHALATDLLATPPAAARAAEFVWLTPSEAQRAIKDGTKVYAAQPT